MAKIFFLSGPPGCGKSTAILRVIEWGRGKGLTVGGLVTPELRVCGSRTGFKVVDVLTGKERIFAHIEFNKRFRVGKYGVNVSRFEEVSLNALDIALKSSDVIVIDEIGKMELMSWRFKEKLYVFFETVKGEKKLVAATLHRAYIDKFRGLGKLYWLTKSNWERILNKLIEEANLFFHSCRGGLSDRSE